jgi:hypothetical protein
MVACDLNPVPFDILKRIQLLRGYLNPNDLTYKYAPSTEYARKSMFMVHGPFGANFHEVKKNLDHDAL